MTCRHLPFLINSSSHNPGGVIHTRGQVDVIHGRLDAEQMVRRVSKALVDGEAKVPDPDVAVDVEEYVGRLEIAVDDAVFGIGSVVVAERTGRRDRLERGEVEHGGQDLELCRGLS